MAGEWTGDSWEERYASHASHGPLRPHPFLVAEAGPLPPGAALEAGCGEGANALWLAEQGWQVTAVDVSATALERARRHAATAGAEVARRVDWLRRDLTTWQPPRAAFQLVTSHYVHPAGSAQDLLDRLAQAVAPGGTLIVVDHDPSDAHAHAATSAEELAAGLPAEDGWTVEVVERRDRHDAGPHGEVVELRDVVLRARRR